MYCRSLILLILIGFTSSAWSQDSLTTIDRIASFPGNFFNKINSKSALLELKLERQTEKYLLRLARREQKLKKQLSKIDSNASGRLFSNSEEQYRQLLNRMATNQPAGTAPGLYQPGVDSIKTSLSFLQQNSGLLTHIKGIKEKVNGSLTQVNQLQSKLQESEQIKAFIHQRKELIKQTLSRYSNLPNGIIKNFNDLNKDLYYYTQQVIEYRDLLNDPDRLVQKGLDILSRTTAFQQFMQQHSELAALFRLPDNYGSPQALTGLQTRTQVQQLIQAQLASAGPNAQQLLQQNLQSAQAQLSQLKDKINQLGAGGGSSDMADLADRQSNFKPNNQRTKSFLKRLEYGTNIQSAKSTYFFPVTTDIGLSLGYKLNDKNVIGIGASYKVGWGKDIRHISVTNEGLGLRSFADIKLKGSFYASGGFEYNYQPLAGSISPSVGGGQGEVWQQSGLAGVSKIISLKSKLFKKTKIQLLWDFLSYSQVPRTQAIKFRAGYNF